MSALEQAACPLCGSAAAEPTPYAAEPYRVVRCAACRLWFLSPRLTAAEMGKAYAASDYFAGGASGYADYADQEVSLRLTFRRLLGAMAARGITGASVLDVGCGYGYFLDEARRHFSRRVGTDFSPAAAERARALADEVYVGGPDALPADMRFDVITALHVVEHVYEPRAFVRALAERLNPGGWLLLAAPDMGSAWRRVLGRRWPSFKYPEHVSFFDRTTLTALFATEPAFAAAQPVPYPHAFPLGEVFAKVGMRGIGRGARLPVWLPATTIALAARKSRQHTR